MAPQPFTDQVEIDPHELPGKLLNCTDNLYRQFKVTDFSVRKLLMCRKENSDDDKDEENEKPNRSDHNGPGGNGPGGNGSNGGDGDDEDGDEDGQMQRLQLHRLPAFFSLGGTPGYSLPPPRGTLFSK